MPDEKSDNNSRTPEQEEANRILTRVKQESETVGLSSTKRVADSITEHFKGEDVDQNEWAELWGTRIGRILGAIAFVALTVYLMQTYIFGG